jgi:hypothetical protein
MRNSQLSELNEEGPKGQGSNVLSIGRARRPDQEERAELITAADARRLGVYEKKLYAWVAAGLVEAFRTRFTAYTLYSRSQIEQAIRANDTFTDEVQAA